MTRAPRRGRPPKAPIDRFDVAVALRLNEAMALRLDAHVERLRAAQPAIAWTRAAAARELLAAALDAAAAVSPLLRSRARRGRTR